MKWKESAGEGLCCTTGQILLPIVFFGTRLSSGSSILYSARHSWLCCQRLTIFVQWIPMFFDYIVHSCHSNKLRWTHGHSFCSTLPSLSVHLSLPNRVLCMLKTLHPCVGTSQTRILWGSKLVVSVPWEVKVGKREQKWNIVGKLIVNVTLDAKLGQTQKWILWPSSPLAITIFPSMKHFNS